MAGMLHAMMLLLSATAFLWLRRIHVALKTLREVPAVEPVHEPASAVKVSVLIPARNEEKNLTACLPSLLRQTGISCETIVANDRSTDGTEEVLKKAGFIPRDSSPCGLRMTNTYVNIRSPGPASWTGKNYALTQIAPLASGDWLLFTDADTMHEPTSILSAVRHAEKHNLDFLSLLPRCIAGSMLEKIVQPMAMGLMGLWFPLDRVNDPKDPLYFANGQFLLIRKTLYERLGGHTAVAEEFLEDFALMRKAKACGASAACHFGQSIYGTRMYQGWSEIRRGWRRIYRHAARDTAPVLFAWLAGVFAGSVFPVLSLGWLAANRIGFFGPGLTAWALAFLNLLLMWGTALKTHRMLRAPSAHAFFQPLAALVLCGVLADACRLALFKQSTRWRG